MVQSLVLISTRFIFCHILLFHSTGIWWLSIFLMNYPKKKGNNIKIQTKKKNKKKHHQSKIKFYLCKTIKIAFFLPKINMEKNCQCLKLITPCSQLHANIKNQIEHARIEFLETLSFRLRGFLSSFL